MRACKIHMTNYELIKIYRKKLELPLSSIPTTLNNDDLVYYLNEIHQLLTDFSSQGKNDLLTPCLALSKIVFKTMEIAAHIGLPFDEILDEVIRSKMRDKPSTYERGYFPSRYATTTDSTNEPNSGILNILSAKTIPATTNMEDLGLILSSPFHLSLQNLLSFYEQRDAEATRHSSAVTAIVGEELFLSILNNYWHGKGTHFAVLNRKCNTGSRTGKRLDAWVEITNEEGKYQYQTEIKNWSAHSLGGISPPNDDSEDSLKEYRINRWLRQFDSSSKTLKSIKAQKVLTKMKADKEDWKIRPLIIFWDAMHPTGKSDPFFKVEVTNPNFDDLWVFSVANYVRQLIDHKVNYITVNLKNVNERLKIINSFCSKLK